MTFTIDWDKDVSSKIPGNRQVWQGGLNIVHEFVQAMGGVGIWNNMPTDEPKLKGITAWADKKYGITVVDRYTHRIEHHAMLGPNPMDTLEKSIYSRNGPAYIPYDSFDPPWGIGRYHPTKDELRLFMDPVFVGPRSPSDQRFFHSQRIRLGLRKKHLGPRNAYASCQTPELQRWQEDVFTSRAMFVACGLESAAEWATKRGWKEGKFWTTPHLDVDGLDITLPGCEDKPDTYEKLLFVMRFAGKN
jgi:hypothetical protein